MKEMVWASFFVPNVEKSFLKPYKTNGLRDAFLLLQGGGQDDRRSLDFGRAENDFGRAESNFGPDRNRNGRQIPGGI